VDRGIENGLEINRVVYDPKVVSVGEMEGWLAESGTLLKTLPAPPGRQE